MKKSTQLNRIKDRLPDDIIIYDETSFDFTDDEFVGILSWIKYFNEHYALHKKECPPAVMNPIISLRLSLDFGVYHIPCDRDEGQGEFIIYISENKTVGPVIKTPSVKYLIDNYHL